MVVRVRGLEHRSAPGQGVRGRVVEDSGVGYRHGGGRGRGIVCRGGGFVPGVFLVYVIFIDRDDVIDKVSSSTSDDRSTRSGIVW